MLGVNNIASVAQCKRNLLHNLLDSLIIVSVEFCILVWLTK